MFSSEALKKGDATDPANYRGIALISCITKLFTSILNSRLTTWAEGNRLIPECQSGFRKGRGCSDQIFSLAGLFQIHLRTKRRRVFTIFVDFKRCFDSIDHYLLWSKLDKLGVSAKFIQTVRNLYDQSSFTVRTTEGNSSEIPVTEGVLQGEILSPLLFSLFTSDMETFFRNKGLRGLSINPKDDLLLLQYADDTAILCYSEGDVQLKLKTLREYCDLNGLTVNVQKTKVMITSKGGRNSRCSFVFRYGMDIVEIVKQYTYLGIIFTSTGNFNVAASAILKKAMSALGPLWNILWSSRCQSYQKRLRLFEALVESCLLYSVETWGFCHASLVEKLQLKFLKRSFGVCQFTPSYAVRLHAGRIKTETTIYSRMLRHWIRVLNMPEDRTPKKIFKRLCEQVEDDANYNSDTNWAWQIKFILSQAGASDLWGSQDSATVVSRIPQIITTLARKSWEDDISRATNSTTSFYKLYTDEDPTASFLLSTPFFKSLQTVQLRLASKKYPFLISGSGIRAKIDPTATCEVCNMNSQETLEHLLFICPQYQHLRNSTLNDVFQDQLRQQADSNANMLEILKSPDDHVIESINLYVCGLLKVRNFLLDL